MITRYLLPIIFLWCYQGILHAQHPVLRFEHLSSEEGLANTTINHILQDSRGFVWVATQGGLHEFDGYQFKVYRHREKDTLSISNNEVLFLHEDRRGMIWIGTRDGLNRYDRGTNRFTVYRAAFNNKNFLRDKSIRFIHEDGHGYLWVAVSELGLIRFDPQQDAFDRQVQQQPNNLTGLSSNHIKAIVEDTDQYLWLGSDNGLTRFDPEHNTFENYFPEPDNSNSLPHRFIKTIHADRDGNFWIGTDGGLSFARKNGGKIISFTNFKAGTNATDLRNNFIKSVCTDDRGNAWVATDHGLHLYNAASASFSVYVHDVNERSSLLNNYCRYIMKDRQGIMWIGTDGGISKYDAGRFPFRPVLGNDQRVLNTFVTAVYEDAARNLWIGTNDGLLSYTPGTGKFTSFVHSAADPSSISQNLVTAIAQDHAGTLWIGTDHGLNRFDPKQRGFRKYFKVENDPGSLSFQGILTLLVDSTNTLWVGTWDGLNVYDSVRDNFMHYKPGIVSGRVQALLRDRDGELWVGTRTRLIRLMQNDSGGDEVKVYTRVTNDSTSLSYNNIITLYEARNGLIWAGTSGGGLNCFDKKANRFTRFTWDDGLPSDNIVSIEEDARGNLWIGTDKGLSRFDATTRLFTTYNASDGLQNDVFNAKVSYRSRNGELFFGGISGLNIFHPDSINTNPFSPPVYISDLQIFNKPVLPGHPVLPKAITELQEITFDYTDKVFTLGFVALNYRNPDKNQYAYKMEDFDADWNYTSAGRRFATYTNLSPGRYVFRVRSTNNNGLWSDHEAVLSIVIRPPFWMTWWFYLLCVLGAGVLVFLGMQLRFRHLQEVQSMLTHEVAIRTEELRREKESLEEANIMITDQRDEIERQKQHIEQERSQLAQAQEVIREQNEKLQQSNTRLEEMVKARTHELKQTVEKMQEASNELDFFVYRTAHDLKGPIARLEGLSYVGQLEPDSKEAFKYLKKVEEVSREMNKMLGRLLRTRTINRQELRIRDLNLSRTVNDVVNELLQAEQIKDLKFVIDIPSQLTIKSDPELLNILLENIIHNAMRYRDQARTDSYMKVISKLENDRVSISIEDNGIGIQENIRKNIFEMFFIGTALSSGFGLGLYEARLIARKLQGSVELDHHRTDVTELVIRLPQNY